MKSHRCLLDPSRRNVSRWHSYYRRGARPSMGSVLPLVRIVHDNRKVSESQAQRVEEQMKDNRGIAQVTLPSRCRGSERETTCCRSMFIIVWLKRTSFAACRSLSVDNV